MAAIIKELYKGYLYIFYDLPNPQSVNWTFVGNPIPPLLILVGYLYFVLDFGPKWMEKRQPFKLERVLQIYNLIQVLCSAYIVAGMFRYGFGYDYSLRCQPTDWSDNPNALQMTKYMYIYFLVKIADLLDTIFFVLRKKNNQISFLHVYHHTGMVVMSWGGVMWFGNGHVLMVPFLNSVVHVVMYFYYFLTSLDDGYRRFMWWKRHITQLQIVQFLYLIFHFGQLLFDNPCGVPQLAINIIIPQNIFMLVLFTDFYYKAYLKKKK